MFYHHDPDNQNTHFFLGPWPGAFGAGVFYAVILVAIGLVRSLPPWIAMIRPLPYGQAVILAWGQVAMLWLFLPVSALSTWVLMRSLNLGTFSPARVAQIFARVWVVTALLMLVRDLGLALLGLFRWQALLQGWLTVCNPLLIFCGLFAVAAFSAFGLRWDTIWLILASLVWLGVLLLVTALVQIAIVGGIG